ncbi:class I SAM-dependent methyltransferase [uncultured Cyclobacterium sp.]|uniref:class I SAM-dependent methyltransferase n=1 Tax=uncultured Cyclobacterium sp. TaxID=453820 RepID=UPI0030EED03A
MSYLEIGLQTGLCRDNVKATQKTTIDPDKNANSPTFLMTSKEFFSINQKKFDIIFIDGLHHSSQVYEDILESLNILNLKGTILLHDMLPTSKEMQQVPRISKVWTGDCYKAFIKLRIERTDLEMYTIDTDWGIGVIQRGIQAKLNIDSSDITYESFLLKKKNG